jgi:hypothetical protein
MDSEHSRWRAVKDHTPESSEPLCAAEGDLLRFERRPTEWEGWLWCTDRKGLKGWVPEHWVAIEGDSCRMTRDYTSLELPVSRGEVLVVRETESGWAWAVGPEGRQGWVPLRCLERLPDRHRSG